MSVRQHTHKCVAVRALNNAEGGVFSTDAPKRPILVDRNAAD